MGNNSLFNKWRLEQLQKNKVDTLQKSLFTCQPLSSGYPMWCPATQNPRYYSHRSKPSYQPSHPQGPPGTSWHPATWTPLEWRLKTQMTEIIKITQDMKIKFDKESISEEKPSWGRNPNKRNLKNKTQLSDESLTGRLDQIEYGISAVVDKVVETDHPAKEGWK